MKLNKNFKNKFEIKIYSHLVTFKFKQIQNLNNNLQKTNLKSEQLFQKQIRNMIFFKETSKVEQKFQKQI
jgi:hypothetical protein